MANCDQRVHVAVGLVVNDQDQVLIARRPDHLHQGGFWEFPGGKVESSESVYDALIRELFEEVNITVQHALPFMTVKHDYPDKLVLLDVWKVTHFQGEAAGQEGQKIRWVFPADLESYKFPEGNREILSGLL